VQHDVADQVQLKTGLALLVGAVACGQAVDPPGRVIGRETVTSARIACTSTTTSTSTSTSTSADGEPGQGERIASIAMRTWIYQEPREDAQKLGYLRAGAVVERAKVAAGTRDCAGGWYRIAPRGFVCVGKGASLDVAHPVVLAAGQGPRRGEPMPYRYVLSRDPPPQLYLKLPSEAEQKEVEGRDDRERSIALHGHEVRSALGAADPIPELLAQGHELPKPYGADAALSYQAHRGKAREDSAYGLIATYDWTGRPMGLTTELDVIPLDHTRVARLSPMRGIVVAPRVGSDAAAVWPAFVVSMDAPIYELDATGVPRDKGRAPYRSGWVLTGKSNVPGAPVAKREGARSRVHWRGLVETTAGVWLAADHLRIAELRDDPSGFAADGRKWVDVSIRKQLLVAYEGRRPVYATLVSTGAGEMGDPEKTSATVRGTFMIAAKHVSGTMDGDEQTRESFDLRDVPYIQYFYKGYALHGAYWHDEFGKVRSHGCINLAPADAAWLFDWTEPNVPPGWHGALNPKHGTLVHTHP
jgi:lipoprotein-anchoring transpeptidase ErfK/SrfK